MDSDRNIKKNGLVNWIILLIVGLASIAVARLADSATGQVGTFFLGFGFLVAVVSYFQMRLEDSERAEREEYEELTKSRSGSALFESKDAEAFTARRSREQFERVFVPGFSALLFLLLGVAVYWLATWLPKAPAPDAGRAIISAAFYGVFFLVLLLLGKYAAGLAQFENQRLLRPGASFMLLGAFVSLIAALTEGAIHFGFPIVDGIVAKVLTVVLGLIAVELLLNLIFEIYRPRIKGQTARLLYESRLVGLLGQPGGLITTAAQALDYQFGFKVSETWFYRFLERAIAWIVLLQLGVLLGSTTFVVIEPHEEALLERFGKPRANGSEIAVLKPGVHFKLPWPFDRVYRYNTQQIQSISVGFIPKDDHRESDERVLLWTKAHEGEEEFNLLVASREQTSGAEDGEKAVPVNLLNVSIPVHFVVQDVRAWAYNHADAATLLEKIAAREVVRHLVSVDIDDIMSSGRLETARVLQERIQQRADELKLGLKVVFLGLQDIHPPVAVAEAYEAVNGAIQQRAGRILFTEGEIASRLPRARAEATKRISEAEAYRSRTVAEAGAAAGRFTNQIAAYQASPTVYSQRTYLDTLARAIAPSRKYVLGVTNTDDVVIMNLEDKVRMDLMDIELPKSQSKK
jgi:modulator of FtsH protease HflK